MGTLLGKTKEVNTTFDGICDMDVLYDIGADCILSVSLRNNVSVSEFHLFARKYKASQQVLVIEEGKRVVLTYAGTQTVACCNAYKKLSTAPVVRSVELTLAWNNW